MTDKIFLIDSDSIISYNKLLCDINKLDLFYPIYQSKNLYDFFLNFLLGLLKEQDVILIDQDLSNNEIASLGILDINKNPIAIRQNKMLSIDDFINKIEHSTSEITIFTSGTTGQPKKITHTIFSLCRNVHKSLLHKCDIWGFAYNPTHMAGLQVFFQAIFNSNTLINVFHKNRNEILNSFIQNGITNISATPTFYRMLLPVEQSFTNVKRVTLGGEKTTDKLIELLKKIFPNAKINNVYASTEAGALFSAHGEYFKIPPQIIDKIKIVDGELLIHESLLGKSNGLEIKNGFYHTSDLVEWVNKTDSIFRFNGRKNELLNIGGFKVNPSEIEDAINKIEGVVNTLVYGKPNSVLGNILCADIQTNKNISEIDIRQYLQGKLQDFKIPRRIKFVKEFNLTRTGKIKKI